LPPPRRHALRGLVGAGLASAAHLLLGATASSFDAGLLGFNGALTALALADCGLVSMLGGVAVAVVLQAVAACFGWPVMTAPFVLATWSMQWFQHRFTHGAAASEPAERKETGGPVTAPVSARRAS
jgi:urea transporter